MGRQPGFALIAALLAIWILSSVGLLAFTVTTRDIRISSRMVGEKRAFYASETGVHSLMQGFDPFHLDNSTQSNVPVDTRDSSSQFDIARPYVPAKGPAAVPLAGYSVAGGQEWGATRYMATVTGKNTKYASTVTVDVGVGFGPVEITTAHR